MDLDKISFFNASADRLPIKTGAFQIAIYSEIIEHLDNVDEALSEANRILAPGGSLLITFPVWWVEVIITFFNRHFMKHSGHIRRFTPRKIRCLLNKYGFEIVKKKNYYFEWALAYTIEAIFSRRFINIDRRYDRNGIVLEGSRWDRLESAMKKTIKQAEKLSLGKIVINFLNLIYPKSYIFLCRKMAGRDSNI